MSVSALASPRALENFHYDSMDRVIAQGSPGGAGTRNFYRDTQVANALSGAEQRRHIRAGDHLLGVCDKAGAVSTTTLLGAEQQGSVLRAARSGGTADVAYTPYGEGAAALLPGFNGQQAEPSTGYYLLGSGYRAYNPRLMRFNSPDSFSPFDGAGLNPYTYCVGDPINRSDPTGHMSIGAWIGVAMGAVAVVVGVAIIAVVAGPIIVAGLGGAATSGITIGGMAAIASGALTIGAGATGIASAGLREKDPYSDFANNMGNISMGLGIAAAVIGGAAALSKAYDKALISAFDMYAKSGGSRAAATVSARVADGAGSARLMLSANSSMAVSPSTRALGALLLQPFTQLARNAASLMTQLQNPRVVSAAQHFAKAMAKNMRPRLPGSAKPAGETGAAPAPWYEFPANPAPASPAHASRIRTVSVASRSVG